MCGTLFWEAAALSKKKKQPYFRGDEWFNRKVGMRTREALDRQNAQFAVDHGTDSEESLLTYVRQAAKCLGHTPNAGELIGGAYIAARLGGWEKVVAAAGLREPGMQPVLTNRQIYKEEFRRQARLFQQERRVQKAERLRARQARSAAAQAEKMARAARDAEWGEAHQADTEAQLLDYVRGHAHELGRTPYEREVPGGTYIAARFGGWGVALALAGLPLQGGPKVPQPTPILQSSPADEAPVHAGRNCSRT